MPPHHHRPPELQDEIAELVVHLIGGEDEITRLVRLGDRVRGEIDDVIDPAQTRDVLGLAFATALNAPIPERPRFGTFRM